MSDRSPGGDPPQPPPNSGAKRSRTTGEWRDLEERIAWAVGIAAMLTGAGLVAGAIGYGLWQAGWWAFPIAAGVLLLARVSWWLSDDE